MNGNPQGCQPLHDVLNFTSINVGRGGTTQDIALARAGEIRIDVLLVQEPWWSERTKSHPGFVCHLPFGGTGVRPRAATYTRKNMKEIDAVQIFSSSTLTGDYCWVIVNGITFMNV